MKQIVGNGGWPGLIRDVLFSLFGSMLVGLAVAVFTIPNDIAPGGVSGMATALAAVSPIRVGVWTLLLNIPLLLAAWRLQGPHPQYLLLLLRLNRQRKRLLPKPLSRSSSASAQRSPATTL